MIVNNNIIRNKYQYIDLWITKTCQKSEKIHIWAFLKCLYALNYPKELLKSYIVIFQFAGDVMGVIWGYFLIIFSFILFISSILLQ